MTKPKALKCQSFIFLDKMSEIKYFGLWLEKGRNPYFQFFFSRRKLRILACGWRKKIKLRILAFGWRKISDVFSCLQKGLELGMRA